MLGLAVALADTFPLTITEKNDHANHTMRQWAVIPWSYNKYWAQFFAPLFGFSPRKWQPPCSISQDIIAIDINSIPVHFWHIVACGINGLFANLWTSIHPYFLLTQHYTPHQHIQVLLCKTERMSSNDKYIHFRTMRENVIQYFS